MDKKRKSLEGYISEVVDEFNYQDFQPPIDSNILLGRLAEILSHDSPFWKPTKLPESWHQHWVALEIKSHRNWEPINIGFCIRAKSIHTEVFHQIDGSRFLGKTYEADINIDEVWMDHGKLSTFLTDKFQKCLQYQNDISANRKMVWP